MENPQSAVEQAQKQDFRESHLSPRTFLDYVELLEIPESEINSESLILDIGAGERQELANQAEEKLGTKSNIFSLDPRLSLDEKEDLDTSGANPANRIAGRNEHHALALAGITQELPFGDETFDNAYGLFSAPYYMLLPKEIETTMSEIIRVIKRGGTVRLYPVLKDQISVVRQLLEGMADIDYSDKLKSKDEDGEENWLLVIHKQYKF